MFTGIIQAIGTIRSLTKVEQEWRLVVTCGSLDLGDVKVGDSIAVNGCCLTAVGVGEDSFAADVSEESMRCTALGTIKEGSSINLEKAMQATDRFGGHIVSGHIDGVGILVDKEPEGQSLNLEFETPDHLQKYIAPKGSICIDGTSLTVNKVSGNKFAINIIPHTQTTTIISGYKLQQKVNLEVDLIARYLERLLEQKDDSYPVKIDKDFLGAHGFD
ncbi:MAG: riboflavin synthase [Gammaproteobacteria bacterium]|nr:riboflavin synthase [Gammaproteobacteria bacterium]|tara:strand:+ start:760 stop:1410 length:651 start_codon:yes stop_codon:yes gene_type:complete